MHFAILLIALPFVVTVAFVFLPISRGTLVMIFSLLRADPGKIVCSAPNILGQKLLLLLLLFLLIVKKHNWI